MLVGLWVGHCHVRLIMCIKLLLTYISDVHIPFLLSLTVLFFRYFLHFQSKQQTETDSFVAGGLQNDTDFSKTFYNHLLCRTFLPYIQMHMTVTNIHGVSLKRHPFSFFYNSVEW